MFDLLQCNLKFVRNYLMKNNLNYVDGLFELLFGSFKQRCTKTMRLKIVSLKKMTKLLRLHKL